MPKDPTRNVDRYKVRGGQFDDLDRTKSEGALARDAELPLTGGRGGGEDFIPGESPQGDAERKQRLVEEVRAKAEARGRGARASSKKGAGRDGAKGGAKKSAKSAGKSAKKAAKKAASASQSAAKKSKSAAGAKGGGKKSAAGRKGAGGREPSGGAAETQKKRAGKKVGSSPGGGRLSGPGAG